jgi:hypothetical protein
MDTTPLRDAYRTLLDAATTVADAGAPAPPRGEWTADQILAHVALINAATITATATAASGAVATYDNRIASDTWTLARVIALAGSNAGLRERIRLQAEALCALRVGGPAHGVRGCSRMAAVRRYTNSRKSASRDAAEEVPSSAPR